MDRNMNQQSYDIEKLENIILESIIRFPDTRYLMSSIPYTHMQTSVNKLCPFSGPSSLGTEKNKPNTPPWTSLKMTFKQSLRELISLRKKLGHSQYPKQCCRRNRE